MTVTAASAPAPMTHQRLKRKGMYLGRPELVTAADVIEMKKLRKQKMSVVKIAKKYGIKPSTVYARTNKKKAA